MPEPSLSSRAESVYAEALRTRARVDAGGLGELCREHPELADELRALHRTFALLSEAGRAYAGGDPPGAAPLVDGYRCTRLLGRGGMGEVWEATDVSLGRRVALKLLHGGGAASERAVERLRREASTAARLRHPNLVAVHAVGEQDGRPYIVQELVAEGRTLRDELDELRAAGSVPADWERRTAQRFLALADALAAAHEAGVVHRDVKPQNVLLDAHGAPRLADFGLARGAGDDSLTAAGEFLGTYAYASPEQVGSNGEVGPASDVFSLGVTLYECLTLERAFTGESPGELTRRILETDPPDPRELRRRIPRDLAVICAKAIEKRPERRYAGMAALREDLRRFLANEPVRARPPGPWARAAKWVRRHPTASTAFALLVASLLVLSALLARSRRDRAVARAEAQVSAETVGFLVGLFEAGSTTRYGVEEPTLRELIERGADGLEAGRIAEPGARARLLATLGGLLQELGEWQRARALLSEARDLQRGAGGAVEPRLVRRLAESHFDAGEVATALELLEPLRARAEADGADPLEVLETLGLLGVVRMRAGDFSGGKAALLRAVAAAEELGTDPRIAAELLAKIGFEHAQRGEVDEAQPLVDAACAALEPYLEAGNPAALDAFTAGAVLRSARGDAAGSEELLALIAEIARERLGPAHARTLTAEGNLGTLLIRQGRAQEALPIFARALAGAEERYGARSEVAANLRLNLTNVYYSLGRLDEALDTGRAGLEAARAVLGPASPVAARFATGVALVLERMGRPDEGATLVEETLPLLPQDAAERPQLEATLARLRAASAR